MQYDTLQDRNATSSTADFGDACHVTHALFIEIIGMIRVLISVSQSEWTDSRRLQLWRLQRDTSTFLAPTSILFASTSPETLWAGLEMWNVFSYILIVTPKVSSKRSPCSRDVLKRIGLITYWKFWSSTEGGYLVSGICPSKSSRVNSFCTNSSTFLMSEVLKLSTVSEVARLLSFALLQTLPHLFMRYQGHRSGGFL